MERDFGLLAAWRNGDRSAGGELIRRHYGAVARFFEVKAGHVADDLTQATLLAAVEARDRFSETSTFRAYLFGIARRQLLQFLRKTHRGDAAMKEVEGRGPDTGLTASGLVAMQDEQRVLLLALNRLDEDLQIAMQLHYWEGMRGTEIAEVLDIPVSTVRNRLSRAREEIRSSVRDLAPGPRVSKSLVDDLAAWTRSLVGPAVEPPPKFAEGTADDG